MEVQYGPVPGPLPGEEGDLQEGRGSPTGMLEEDSSRPTSWAQHLVTTEGVTVEEEEEEVEVGEEAITTGTPGSTEE